MFQNIWLFIHKKVQWESEWKHNYLKISNTLTMLTRKYTYVAPNLVKYLMHASGNTTAYFSHSARTIRNAAEYMHLVEKVDKIFNGIRRNKLLQL